MTTTLRRLIPLIPVAAIAAGGILLAGCGGTHASTTTATTVSTTSSGGGSRIGPTSPPTSVAVASTAGALAQDWRGYRSPTADLGQTAALSPPSNSNGTLPASPGVGPAGGPGAAEVVANAAALGAVANAIAADGAPTPDPANSGSTEVGAVPN